MSRIGWGINMKGKLNRGRWRDSRYIWIIRNRYREFKVGYSFLWLDEEGDGYLCWGFWFLYEIFDFDVVRIWLFWKLTYWFNSSHFKMLVKRKDHKTDPKNLQNKFQKWLLKNDNNNNRRIKFEVGNFWNQELINTKIKAPNINQTKSIARKPRKHFKTSLNSRNTSQVSQSLIFSPNTSFEAPKSIFPKSKFPNLKIDRSESFRSHHRYKHNLRQTIDILPHSYHTSTQNSNLFKNDTLKGSLNHPKLFQTHSRPKSDLKFTPNSHLSQNPLLNTTQKSFFWGKTHTGTKINKFQVHP